MTKKEITQKNFGGGDDSESRKEVKMEQGSSGTFNNSRAEDFDGYAPDDTMITNNSHETTMVDGGNEKQVLAELIQSDQRQMLQEQNGGGSCPEGQTEPQVKRSTGGGKAEAKGDIVATG